MFLFFVFVYTLLIFVFVCVPALVSTSLTESTLKSVPQVVNVQELKDKGPPMPVSNIIR